MAVGLIQQCEKCGDTWDDGKEGHYFCDDYKIALKQERERWSEMTVEEKCDWLKAEIERVRDEIPFNGPIG